MNIKVDPSLLGLKSGPPHTAKCSPLLRDVGGGGYKSCCYLIIIKVVVHNRRVQMTAKSVADQSDKRCTIRLINQAISTISCTVCPLQHKCRVCLWIGILIMVLKRIFVITTRLTMETTLRE